MKICFSLIAKIDDRENLISLRIAHNIITLCVTSPSPSTTVWGNPCSLCLPITPGGFTHVSCRRRCCSEREPVGVPTPCPILRGTLETSSTCPPLSPPPPSHLLHLHSTQQHNQQSLHNMSSQLETHDFTYMAPHCIYVYIQAIGLR